MHEATEKAKEYGCKGTLLDVDRSICDGRFAASIGYGFQHRAIGSLDLRNALRGSIGILKIAALEFDGSNEKNARGLGILFETLGKTYSADMNFGYHLARRHRDKKEFPGIGKFIKDCKTLGPVCIATNGCDIATDVIMEKHDIDGSVSNPVIYSARRGEQISSDPVVFKHDGKIKGGNVVLENPFISGCNIVIKNGEDKRRYAEEMLGRLDLDLDETFVIGDSHDDIPLLRVAGYSASSPLAKRHIKKKTDYQIRYYID